MNNENRESVGLDISAIFKAIKSRWLYFIIFPLLFLIGALVYIYTTPTFYDVKVTFKSRFLDYGLAKQILDNYTDQIKDDNNKKSKFDESVREIRIVPIKSEESYMYLIAQVYDTTAGPAYVQQVLDQFKNNKLVSKIVNLKQSENTALIAEIEEQLRQLEEMQSQSGVVDSDFLVNKLELKQRKLKFEGELKFNQAYHLVDEPLILKKPSGPKPMKMIFFAIFAGVFMAFVFSLLLGGLIPK